MRGEWAGLGEVRGHVLVMLLASTPRFRSAADVTF